jgi:subtilisin family serine protease
MNRKRKFPVYHFSDRGSFLSLATLLVTALLLIQAVPSQTRPPQQGSERKLSDWKMEGSPVTLKASAGEVLMRERITVSTARASTMAQGTGSAAPAVYLVALEFDSAASRARLSVPGVTVLTAFDRFVDVFIPPAAAGSGPDQNVLQTLARAPGLRWFDTPELIFVPPPATPKQGERSREVPEETARGGVAGMTGKGVIVAVIDTGLDFRHPDFVTTDAAGNPTSRLLYYWDTYDESFDMKRGGTKPPYSYPNGRSIGTVYTREQLTTDLRSTTHSIGLPDADGHGTAAAGVAAGNGRASNGANKGVAPDADIIGLRIGDDQGRLRNGWLLNAIVGWLDAVAKKENKPVVISCSFGGHYGPHDGNRVEERELDARFADTMAGRAIVISAGNEQRDMFHSRREFVDRNKSALLVWSAGSRGSYLSLFIRGARGAALDRNRIVVVPAQAEGITPVDLTKNTTYTNVLSGDLVIEVPVASGLGGLFVWNDAATPTEVDAYLIPQRTATFDFPLVSAERIVGTPGTTHQAITVGSYAWNDQFSFRGESTTLVDTCGSPMTIGQLSCYSSTGYVRGNVVKPDVVAPGEWYSAPDAKKPSGMNLDNAYAMLDSSGKYRLFNGTSAAAPYTAGVIALMMQKKPSLTVGEIKRLLRTYATADQFTGKVPNPKWGNGKLNLAAVRAILNAIR